MQRAALLLSAALALPVLLNAMLGGLLKRSRSVLGQWFLADCRQQLPASSCSARSRKDSSRVTEVPSTRKVMVILPTR